MSVIVAGATGLVGSSLSDAFSNSGEEVFGINRSVLDLTNFDATLDFFQKVKPRIVVDAAAKVGGIAANNSFPVEFLMDNLTIQGNLMRAAFETKVEKFVFLGSSCIYPRECKQPIKEEYLMTGPLEQTNSAYAIAKIAGIELINSYRKEFGLNWISLMPTNLYGPKDNFDLDKSHVLPALIRKFIEAVDLGAGEVWLWGTGKPLREFLHVDDLARAIVIASKEYNSNLHLNIGSGQEISILELANKVGRISGFQGEIKWDSSKPDGTPRKILDNSRMMELGWAPEISLEDGITATINWYREASERNEVRK